MANTVPQVTDKFTWSGSEPMPARVAAYVNMVASLFVGFQGGSGGGFVTEDMTDPPPHIGPYARQVVASLSALIAANGVDQGAKGPLQNAAMQGLEQAVNGLKTTIAQNR